MADVKINLDISARGDAPQRLQSAADAAQKASAQYQALAASVGRAADSQSRLSSGGVSGPSGGGGGGGAAEQALTGAARQMSASTQQLAQSQRQSAAETRTAMQTQAQRSTESAQARAAGQGAEGGGLLSGALGKLVGGFLGLQGAVKLLGGAAGALNARNDPTLDPSLRAQKTAEALPFVGGLAKSFNELKDAASGVTQAMKETDLRFEQLGAAAKRTGEAEQARAALSARAAEPAARAEAIGRQQFFGRGGVLPGGVPQIREGIDRTTVAGEREYEQAVRRQPAEAAVRGTRLEETAARTEAAGAREQEARLRREYQEAKARSEAQSGRVQNIETADRQARQGLPAGPEAGWDKAGRLREYKDAELAAQQMLQANQALQQAVERRGQAEVKVEQASSAARKANIGLMKEQLAVVNDEVQRISSASQAWAGLSAAEKMAAENALQRAKAQGIAALSGEERGLLGRAAPQFLGKELEKAGAADPAFKRFQEAQGEKADLAAARKQQVELTNKVQLEVAFDEAKLAEGIAKKMGAVFDKLDRLIQDRLDAQTREFLAGLKVRGVKQ